jgi:RIO kinase 1
VHGDMSEFNILLGADGPVIIDLPQAVDVAANNYAPRMLVRDVDNLRRFFARFAPELTGTDDGKE